MTLLKVLMWIPVVGFITGLVTKDGFYVIDGESAVDWVIINWFWQFGTTSGMIIWIKYFM